MTEPNSPGEDVVSRLVEDVLYHDHSATAAPWTHLGEPTRGNKVCAVRGPMVVGHKRIAGPRLAVCYGRRRKEDQRLIVHYRSAAPRLAREVLRLREAMDTIADSGSLEEAHHIANKTRRCTAGKVRL